MPSFPKFEQLPLELQLQIARFSIRNELSLYIDDRSLTRSITDAGSISDFASRKGPGCVWRKRGNADVFGPAFAFVAHRFYHFTMQQQQKEPLHVHLLLRALRKRRDEIGPFHRFRGRPLMPKEGPKLIRKLRLDGRAKGLFAHGIASSAGLRLEEIEFPLTDSPAGMCTRVGFDDFCLLRIIAYETVARRIRLTMAHDTSMTGRENDGSTDEPQFIQSDPDDRPIACCSCVRKVENLLGLVIGEFQDFTVQTHGTLYDAEHPCRHAPFYARPRSGLPPAETVPHTTVVTCPNTTRGCSIRGKFEIDADTIEKGRNLHWFRKVRPTSLVDDWADLMAPDM